MSARLVMLVACAVVACNPTPDNKPTTGFPVPGVGELRYCGARLSDEPRGTLLGSVAFETDEVVEGEQGFAVLPGHCGQVVVGYAQQGVDVPQVQMMRVQIDGTPLVKPVARSHYVDGWVSDCIARSDKSWACAGGIGHRYGPFEGGWVDLYDESDSLIWSKRSAPAADDVAAFPTGIAAGGDGSLFIVSHPGIEATMRLERAAPKLDDGWSVEVAAADLRADSVDAGPVAVGPNSTVFLGGGRLVDGWWSPVLSRYYEGGELMWQAKLPGVADADVLTRAVAVNAQGISFIASGVGGADAGAGESRAGSGLLTALSPEGDELWTLASEADESIESLLIDRRGNLLSLGTYLVDGSRALVLRTLDTEGNEVWSQRYELVEAQPPSFRQPSLVRGTWLDGSLVVVGWNDADGQPWVGRFAY